MSSVVELGVLSQQSMVQVLAAHTRGPGWVLRSVCVVVGKSFSWANHGNLCAQHLVGVWAQNVAGA